LNEQIHPMGPHHLPFYLAPGSGDRCPDGGDGHLSGCHFDMGRHALFTVASLPERMAHKSEKLQFEIVAILGLLALFTHIHRSG